MSLLFLLMILDGRPLGQRDLVLGEHGAAAVHDRADPGLRVGPPAGEYHGQHARPTGHREGGQQQVGRGPGGGQGTGAAPRSDNPPVGRGT
jgi:hypothetical protein